jgi:hypothetical protein
MALATAYRRLKRSEVQAVEARLQELQKHQAELTKAHDRYLRLPSDADPKERRQLRLDIATLYHRLGQDAQARPWLVSILTEDPNHPPARTLLEEMEKRRQK